MKKSTIFLLILVYIVSFIIVGLFGIQTRAYDELIYVEGINLKAVNSENVTEKYDTEEKMYKFFAYYEEGLVIQLKAEVLPANTTYTEVKVNVDTDLATFEVIEKVFINITVLEAGPIEFDVLSTDGRDFGVHAKLMIL